MILKESETWKIDKNIHINLVSCLSKRLLRLRRYVFGLLPTLSILFHVKIQLFVTLKSDQDSDPDPDPDPHGSALVWLSGS
jgi:hypothetical protein